VGYISSQQLLSTTYGYSQNFITQNASVSSLRFSTATGNNAYISTLTIDQLIFGDGNGWSDFAVLRAVAISTLQINTGILYAPIVSTNQLIGINYATPTNLTSTVIGLGTVGYLSSALTNIGGFGLVSTANLAGLVSTANLVGLVSTANLVGLVSTANLAGLVSTSYLATQIGSTVVGLGTAGYLSSIPSLGGFVSTANLTNLVSTANLTNLVSTANLANLVSTANLASLVSTANLASLVSTANLANLVSTANLASLVSTANLASLVSTSFLNTSLTSSVLGLGTAGYLSTAAYNASLTSTVIGLGTVGYISSQQLLSTTYGYSQNFITQNASISSLRFSTGTANNAYISSLTIDQLTFGDGNGWADFGALRAAAVSTYQVNAGIVYAPIISTQLIIGVNYTTQVNLTSTVIGLGTVGYLSSAITNVGGYGFVSTANLANLVSTANLATLVSTANLVNLISTANLANLVSTANLANLVSTANLANLISTANLVNLISTANLANLVSTANLANLISTANLVNLISTANLANLISTSYLQTQLGSTVIGLGTAGYLSTQISSFLTLSTGNLIVSSITFNSPNSAPVGNNVFVSSSLFFFNQFVIGGTRVQQPQIFTF